MKSQESAANLLHEYIRGVNFMTPEIVGYGWAGPHAYELSKGTGIMGGTIYGVTVVDPGGKRRYDLSKGGFHSQKEVREHLDSIKGTP